MLNKGKIEQPEDKERKIAYLWRIIRGDRGDMRMLLMVMVNFQIMANMDTNTITNEASAKFKDAGIALMHTTEHILNQTMVRLFGCERSKNSHIEKKKSKCDYSLKEAPTGEQLAEVENKVNEVIRQNLPVTISFVSRNEVPEGVDLSKLPDDVSETLRIVKVGDYDTCACIGMHVGNTSEIGRFKILNTDYQAGKLRLRFKLE
jgi:alanyl-tRNA synthetase